MLGSRSCASPSADGTRQNIYLLIYVFLFSCQFDYAPRKTPLLIRNWAESMKKTAALMSTELLKKHLKILTSLTAKKETKMLENSRVCDTTGVC